jgi:hypothetical protein
MPIRLSLFFENIVRKRFIWIEAGFHLTLYGVTTTECKRA